MLIGECLMCKKNSMNRACVCVCVCSIVSALCPLSLRLFSLFNIFSARSQRDGPFQQSAASNDPHFFLLLIFSLLFILLLLTVTEHLRGNTTPTMAYISHYSLAQRRGQRSPLEKYVKALKRQTVGND